MAGFFYGGTGGGGIDVTFELQVDESSSLVSVLFSSGISSIQELAGLPRDTGALAELYELSYTRDQNAPAVLLSFQDMATRHHKAYLLYNKSAMTNENNFVLKGVH